MAVCVVTPSPTGGWLIYEVTPDLPDGSYALTFGDRHEKASAAAHRRGWACFEHHVWKVEDVKDA
jgi:hypothetical protein